MKPAIVLLTIALTACGGADIKQDEPDPAWIEESEICEEMGGDPLLLQVYEVESGDSYISVRCDFPEPEIDCDLKENMRDDACIRIE